MDRSSALVARLDPYWKMEAANALLLPAAMLWLAEGQVGWPALTAMAAMVLMLAVGALYWRAKVRQLRDRRPIRPALLRIRRLRRPALILTLAGAAAAAAAWIVPGLARGDAERWVALAAAVLAVLEYVNYYHRQLQHFDNRADFKRLLSGKGFRRSQMARDLAEM